MFFLFGQRFLDNPRANSRQSLHTGVLWFRMCLLPCWGLASPGGGKKSNEIFVTMGVNGEFLHFGRFWAISQQSVHGSTPNFICIETMSAYVPLPTVGSSGPWGASGGRVKNSKTQKNGVWSHSCIGQLPFLFLSAMPNVVQYIGHRSAHILV